MSKVTVAYITGWGRNGSTVFDNLLGQTDDYFSVGELFRIWEYGLQEDGVCGCGKPVRDCSVWRTILEEAFGNQLQTAITTIADWQQQAVRTNKIPRIGRISRELTTPLHPALDKLDTFYRTIADTTGARVIIDSSKHPMYGALLRLLPSVDVRFIHLVRNPYAVAYSWKRKKLMPDTNRYFRIRSAGETSYYWLAWNISISYLQWRTRMPYLRIRYEDLIADPQRALGKVYAFLSTDTPTYPVNQQREFEMAVNHTIVGNPVKFKRGTIQLRLDSEWEMALSRKDRLTVQLLTWPLLLRYKYHQ